MYNFKRRLIFLQDPYSAGRTFDVSSSSRNLQGAIQLDTSVSYLWWWHILEQKIALIFLKKCLLI